MYTRAAKQIKAQKYFFVTSGTLVLLLFLTLAVQCECYVMRLYICSICFVMQHLASIPMQQYFPYLILGELATQSQQIQQDDEHAKWMHTRQVQFFFSRTRDYQTLSSILFQWIYVQTTVLLISP